jgi:flagellar biosynthesis component FlhA
VRTFKILSDLLLLLAVVLVVVAVVQALKALLFVALAAFAVSVAFTLAKRRASKAKGS